MPHFFVPIENGTEIDCSKAVSPMIYLLANRGICGLNYDKHLSIAKALLEHGVEVDPMPLILYVYKTRAPHISAWCYNME